MSDVCVAASFNRWSFCGLRALLLPVTALIDGWRPLDGLCASTCLLSLPLYTQPTLLTVYDVAAIRRGAERLTKARSVAPTQGSCRYLLQHGASACRHSSYAAAAAY